MSLGTHYNDVVTVRIKTYPRIETIESPYRGQDATHNVVRAGYYQGALYTAVQHKRNKHMYWKLVRYLPIGATLMDEAKRKVEAWAKANCMRFAVEIVHGTWVDQVAYREWWIVWKRPRLHERMLADFAKLPPGVEFHCAKT